MENFFESFACRSRVHCTACRDQGTKGDAWRAALSEIYEMPTRFFPCPENRTAAIAPTARPDNEALCKHRGERLRRSDTQCNCWIVECRKRRFDLPDRSAPVYFEVKERFCNSGCPGYEEGGDNGIQ